MTDAFRFGDAITILVVIVAAATYQLERRRDRKATNIDRESEMQERFSLHEQNCMKLQNLEDFNDRQTIINAKRDQQLTELMVQTARLTEIALSTNRRLEMLEERK